MKSQFASFAICLARVFKHYFIHLKLGIPFPSPRVWFLREYEDVELIHGHFFETLEWRLRFEIKD